MTTFRCCQPFFVFAIQYFFAPAAPRLASIAISSASAPAAIYAATALRAQHHQIVLRRWLSLCWPSILPLKCDAYINAKAAGRAWRLEKGWRQFVSSRCCYAALPRQFSFGQSAKNEHWLISSPLWCDDDTLYASFIFAPGSFIL